jgi:hypothetical protein
VECSRRKLLFGRRQKLPGESSAVHLTFVGTGHFVFEAKLFLGLKGALSDFPIHGQLEIERHVQADLVFCDTATLFGLADSLGVVVQRVFLERSQLVVGEPVAAEFDSGPFCGVLDFLLELVIGADPVDRSTDLRPDKSQTKKCHGRRKDLPPDFGFGPEAAGLKFQGDQLESCNGDHAVAARRKAGEVQSVADPGQIVKRT